MSLPEWCQTHTLLDFMKLMQEDTIGFNNPKKEKGMNEHVNKAEAVLDVVEHAPELDPTFVQDDSDYPVDPLDGEINAFASASALDAEEAAEVALV